MVGVARLDEIRDLYPWSGHRLAVDGGQMHYLDEGQGEVILALHGNPTWSFYWRNLVSAFCDDFRVVVPDHIGCGLSDKPQDWGYRLADHRDNVIELIEHLDLRNITLVVHDWGGAIGMAAAARCPDRIGRLVITNTAAFRSDRIPASIASCRVPIFGTVAVRGFNGFARAAVHRASHNGLSRVVKRGLLLPYDSWANRIATHRFVQDIPLNATHPSYSTLLEAEEGLAQFTDCPMMICWGDDDFCFTPWFRQQWQTRFPNAEVHPWADVGHYVMEDAPDRVISCLSDFIARHPSGE